MPCRFQGVECAGCLCTLLNLVNLEVSVIICLNVVMLVAKIETAACVLLLLL